MVFTGSFRRRTIAAVTTTATREAGTRLKKRGQTIWMARAIQPTATAHRLTVSKQEINSSSFSTVSMGAFLDGNPEEILQLSHHNGHRNAGGKSGGDGVGG